MGNSAASDIRRRGRVLVAGVTALFLAATVGVGPAAAKCQPGRADNGTDYWAGGSRIRSGITGVYSNILNYDPWVQPGSQSLAWVMLTKSTDHRVWAQVGYWENANDSRYTFTQYTSEPNKWWTGFYWPPEPENTYTYYKVTYDGSNWRFYAAGDLLNYKVATFVPNEAQIFGETHTLADQMPGALQKWEWFKDAKAQWAGAWNNWDGTVWTTNDTYFRAGKNTATSIWIYDKACTGT